ncbi:NAD(P)-binding protein [Hypoxylon sp. FL0543]|nr:NAD(P)-binding protein [Hypoxylon sp. FL0543]
MYLTSGDVRSSFRQKTPGNIITFKEQDPNTVEPDLTNRLPTNFRNKPTMAKYNKLAGKHVLVIGGSNGIGRGVVEGSIESGARVTLSGSSPQSAAKAVAEVKAAYPDAPLIGLSCDLSKETVETDLDNLLTEAKNAQGQEIDHIVLTAGDPLIVMKPQDITLEKIRKVAKIRFEMPIGKLADRHLRKSPETSLTISTGGIAERPAPGWSVTAFVATGLTGLTRNLALDLKPTRVNAVEPGPVDTGLWEASGYTPEQKVAELANWGAKLPTGRVGQVEDVAEAYLYLMKDKNATGEIVATRSGGNLI